IRLICVSKMLSGFTVCPVAVQSQFANLHLASRLAVVTELWKELLSARGLSFSSCCKSVIHPSPMASEIARANDGFASKSQRRGVTPFVLLLNRFGNISANSLTVVVRSSCE